MIRGLRKYCKIAETYMKTQLIWRMDVMTDAALSIVKVLVAWLLWSILYKGRTEVAGLGFSAMITYYIISGCLFQMDRSSEISQQMAAMIRNGTFSKYMVIPVRIRGYFIAMTAGRSLFSLVSGVVTTMLWMILLRVEFVHTMEIQVAAGAGLMVILGLLFMAELNYFLGILTLRFADISVFLMIKDNLIALVTGAVIPLVLLPEWMTAWMKMLPFYYITYLPSMLFIGECASEMARGIAVLTGWCAALAIWNHVTYERYRVKYDGVGI